MLEDEVKIAAIFQNTSLYCFTALKAPCRLIASSRASLIEPADLFSWLEKLFSLFAPGNQLRAGGGEQLPLLPQDGKGGPERPLNEF